MGDLPWWLLPALAALILVATHTHLGLHVLGRNVFFVDLALAQVAALGSTVAFLYGFDRSDPVTYYVSLSFAALGALFFALARLPDQRIPEEAIIGLTFAVASAGSILLSAENPHGAEHLRDMMAGSILVVTREELTHAALLYAAIGAFHWVFRRPLLEVSFDRAAAEARGRKVRLWDFLFYLSFAVVITSSVRIAGVLLVFVLLIAPALCGAMFASGIGARLFVGWAVGGLATSGGLALSARMDWPPAQAISCTFSAILLGAAALDRVVRSPHRARTLLAVGATVAALAVSGIGLRALLGSNLLRANGHGAASDDSEPHSHGEPEHAHGDSRHDLLAALADEHDNVRAQAVEKLGLLRDPALIDELARALSDRSDAVREKAAEALGLLGSPRAVPSLRAALANADQDEWVNLREAEALVRCGDGAGLDALIRMATEAEAGLVRREALDKALAFAGHAAAPPTADGAAEALQSLREFWAQNAGHAHWDRAHARFMYSR
jgi:zinc/manganese transport system permease protein